MVTGWLACSPRDEASLWLGKRGTTDSDRVKGDGESIKGVPISSNTRGLAMATSDWQAEEMDKWKRLTEIEIYTNTKTFLCIRPWNYEAKSIFQVGPHTSRQFNLNCNSQPPWIELTQIWHCINLNWIDPLFNSIQFKALNCTKHWFHYANNSIVLRHWLYQFIWVCPT